MLHLPVFLLQLPLHLEVHLSFAFDALLLHISDHSLMHCLHPRQFTSLKWTRKIVKRCRTYSLLILLLLVHEQHDADGAETCAEQG